MLMMLCYISLLSYHLLYIHMIKGNEKEHIMIKLHVSFDLLLYSGMCLYVKHFTEKIRHQH